MSSVTDMTRGKPLQLILRFTLPLFVGNLFQQLYNVVDSIVVGRFVSKDALAAVGASFSLMNFITAILIGICMGCGVVFSQYFGAGDIPRLKRAVSTAPVSYTHLEVYKRQLYGGRPAGAERPVIYCKYIFYQK